ncbi:MAG: diguanylate cyclase domain-containing protein [Methylococcales bacterium]
MIQKAAHATNIASHPAFRGKDVVREQQWQLSNSLQTTLDMDRLIELFSQAVQQTVGHNGYCSSHDPEEIRVTAGLGVTALNRGTSARDLLVNADRAMYQIEQNGRNRVIKAL